MKKLLVTIMTILMCMVLAACSGSAPSGDEQVEDESGYASEDMETSGLGSFSSVDLDGNEVTDAIFAEKDVTVVNVWATFCGPCINEMPDLQKMAEELPDNAQLIGVVIDATPDGTDEIDLAKEICEETGAKFTSILASDSVMEMFANVTAVPTTFIVDKSGNMVCEEIVGANVKAYRQAVENYLAGL